jgi:hypothetical protein
MADPQWLQNLLPSGSACPHLLQYIGPHPVTVTGKRDFITPTPINAPVPAVPAFFGGDPLQTTCEAAETWDQAGS